MNVECGGQAPAARAPDLRLFRTPIITEGEHGTARTLLVEVPGRLLLPAIENAEDPDRMPLGRYELVMATMRRAGMQGLWLPPTGSELFGHPANWPRQLKGCWACGVLSVYGGVLSSHEAFRRIFEALGGFEEGKRIDFELLELG